MPGGPLFMSGRGEGRPEAGGLEPGLRGREPERTCIGCRRRDSKGNLMRMALVDDRLVLDPEGLLPGRGGYLHLSEACATRFARRGGFVTSLRRVLGKEERSRLLEQVRIRFLNSRPGRGRDLAGG